MPGQVLPPRPAPVDRIPLVKPSTNPAQPPSRSKSTVAHMSNDNDLISPIKRGSQFTDDGGAETAWPLDTADEQVRYLPSMTIHKLLFVDISD